MSDLPCNLNLLLDATFGQEQVQFRTDVLLPQPILLAPIDNAHICLTASRNSTSHIALAWTAVTGATNYVLQWGENEDLSSQGSRQVLLAATAFTLVRNRDIRLGQTIYWRVFAINLSGGVSLPSQTRQLTYTCPETSDGQPTKEATFNVEAELLGPDTIRSCEDTTYYVKLSFTSRDADFREICKYEQTTWNVEFIGSATGNVELVPEENNDLKIYVNSRPSGEISGNIKLTAEIEFTDVIKDETFTKTLTKEIISEPNTYGCGLTCEEICIDPEGEVKTWAIGVDLEAIAGDGLTVKDDRNLDPNAGEIVCDCPTLEVNLGCGLIFDDDKKVKVDLDSIAGTGLIVDSGECPTLSVEFPDYPDYDAGCGIAISSDIVSLDYAGIADSGTYQWFNNGCDTTTLTACSPGGGGGSKGVALLQGKLKYETTTEPGQCPTLFAEVNLPHDCTLSTDGELLRVDTNMFGKGLKVNQEEDECVKVELCVPDGTMPLAKNQVTGTNLTSVSDVTTALLYGYVEFDQAEGECGDIYSKTYLPVGCHFSVANNKLALDLTKLAGDGLVVETGECPKLKVESANYEAGCGISIESSPGGQSSTVSLDFDSFSSFAAYAWDSSDCEISYLDGCSTASGLSGTAGVAGLQGLVEYDNSGECPFLHAQVNLPYNCSFTIDNGNLGLNYDIVGKGLSVSSDDCPKIELCVEDGSSEVTTEDLTGTDLTDTDTKALLYGEVFHEADTGENPGCGRLVTKTLLPVGCHFNLATGKLEIDLNSLAGYGIGVDDSGECPKLKVTLFDEICEAPAVTPTVNDYVLGLVQGESGCSLVKFPVTACSAEEPDPEPDPGPSPP